MKFYVDGKLPKDCFECPCFRVDIVINCGLDDGTKDYLKFDFQNKCPLKTIKTLKNRWAKEVSMAKNTDTGKTSKGQSRVTN